MDEHMFIQKLEELVAEFPHQLEQYERGTWAENQVISALKIVLVAPGTPAKLVASCL